MDVSTDRANIRAVLGPTNTGKTYLALDRMLGHASGMIGFPLRLLARENYEKVVRLKGKEQAALITGEEKIVPATAKYFLCTVESMPLERDVGFLGIDEIQMCADPDRGHMFTHRLLHARGRHETMFMGAESIKPLIRRLVPGVEFIERPRFSKLLYSGERKITRLPARSAVVAFSAAEVYALAELIRRQRGGAAVVLGALSPRTRNAQVDMYQAGDVDYLVATDAIGMGLNMDVDHVAFAQLNKFDGRNRRALSAAELAQIAGRAGRHMNDGTFGTTADIGPMDPDVIDRIETHRFDNLKSLFWRNPDLHFSSLEALRRSLKVLPDAPGLVRARPAEDELALENLSRDAAVTDTAQGHDAVKLLWDVCQIPDFRSVGSFSNEHAGLLTRIYRHLMDAEGRLPTDWFAAQVDHVNRVDGDIETLAGRIANIRIWTYIAHRPDWLSDPEQWRERTRDVEDRLSDALHERLTQRFVDQRTAVLVKRMKEDGKLLASVSRKGEVKVEGHYVGDVAGFRYRADRGESALAAKAATRAASKVLKEDMPRRIRDFLEDNDGSIAVDESLHLLWRGDPIAKLKQGTGPLKPQIEVLSSELLEGPQREQIQKRLADWLERRISNAFKPVLEAEKTATSAPVRGILFRLQENFGWFERTTAKAEIAALTKEDRKNLAEAGIRLGRDHVFAPSLLQPRLSLFKGVLWAAANGKTQFPLPPDGPAFELKGKQSYPRALLAAFGYRVLGGLAVKVGALENLYRKLYKGFHRKQGAERRLVLTPDMLPLIGCDLTQARRAMTGLGFIAEESEAGLVLKPRRKRSRPQKSGKPETRSKKPKSAKKDKTPASDSPFADLKQLFESG